MAGQGARDWTNRHIRAGLALVLLSIALGRIVQAGVLTPFDTRLLSAMALAGRAPAWVGDVTHFVSTFGDAGARGIGAALVLAALLWRQRWRSGAIYLATVAVSISGHVAAKALWARPRPHIVPWLDDPQGLSYPSGHAAGAMVVLLLAALLFDRWRLTPHAVGLALVIGMTRPMLGVHWPSDVVGGWLWGAGFALIGAGVARALGLLRTDFSTVSART